MDGILEKAKRYVFKVLKEDLPKNVIYHTFLHTRRVVESAEEIIEASNISEKDKLIVLLAAWFHDIGYIVDDITHEIEGAKVANEFLTKEGVDSEVVKQVEACILATKLSATPKNYNEEILKDADTSHLAKPYFSNVSDLFKQELALKGIAHFSSKEWREENIKLFTQNHKFYTEYAVNNWESKKNEHLKKLLKKRNKALSTQKKEDLKAKAKATLKNDDPEKAVQTMFRVTLRNHIKLSDIADTKANILLSVNAIIISLALANLIPKLDSPTNQHLIVPSLVLVLFSVASIILSILSTRPKVTSGEFTKEDVQTRKANLLFFGNFHKMPLETFQWGIKEVIKDKDYIYEMLTKDLYYLGVVLHKKYKLLKLTYIVFTIGIITSVIVFVFAFFNLDLAEVAAKQLITP